MNISCYPASRVAGIFFENCAKIFMLMVFVQNINFDPFGPKILVFAACFDSVTQKCKILLL